jgi:hypothetical protein
MRLYILRALLVKEFRRHVANRGGIALAALLVVAALLLSVFNPAAVGGAEGTGGAGGGELVGGVHRCLLEFDRETPFIAKLRDRIPPHLKGSIVPQQVDPARLAVARSYPPGTGAVRVFEYPATAEHGRKLGFEIWHPPGDPGAVAVYEAWVLRAAREVVHEQTRDWLQAAGGDPTRLTPPSEVTDDTWAVRDSFRALAAEAERAKPTGAGFVGTEFHFFRNGLGAKPLDMRSAIATAMVVFALYFMCCYLLPTLNCEERERGVLLAQALSPASPAELVAAKFLFYPVIGIGLAAVLAGIYRFAAVESLFFWCAMLAMAGGFLGVGMTVSTLAKTQRAAFMGSMCYLLTVSLLLLVCSQNGIPYLPYLALEFHGPKIVFAAVTGEVKGEHWGHLLAAGGLAATWMVLAGWLFRKRGWQ